MRLLAAAAALAALPAVAQDVARWGPVAENVGTGTAICANDTSVVCAVVLCREGTLSLGLIGIAPEGTEQPAEVAIEVDGETFRREMASEVINDEVVHLGTPVEVGDPLWRSLRSGSRLALSSSPGGDPLDYSLRGSAVELDRVSAACR